MNYIAGDTIYSQLALNDSIYGAVDADSLPTAVAYVNNVASAAVVTVTRTALGLYSLSFVAGEANDVITLVITAFVSGKEYREVQGPWMIDAVRVADPLSADPGDYADGTVGALIGKLDVGAPDDPVIVIPDPAQDPQVCRLYGYVRTEEGRPAANVAITAELIPTATAAKIPGYLISRKKVTFSTNSEGRVIDAFGNLFVELVRTDSIVPNATEWKYQITCSEAKLSAQTVLEEDRFDIATLIDS